MSSSDEARFAAMLETWRDLEAESEALRLREAEARCERWTPRLRALEADARDLRDAGLWHSGPRSTLRVLGLTHDRRAHSALLAWLLDPLAPHQRGRALLEAIAARCDFRVPTHVRVKRDFGKRSQRADVAVVGRGLTLILLVVPSGAAPPRQLDNLLHVLASEPHLRVVTLTPSGARPSTLSEPHLVTPLSFRELIPILTALAHVGPPCPPLHDYLLSLHELCL